MEGVQMRGKLDKLSSQNMGSAAFPSMVVILEVFVCSLRVLLRIGLYTV